MNQKKVKKNLKNKEISFQNKITFKNCIKRYEFFLLF